MPTRASTDAPVAVIGGGVVGAAVLYALARRGVAGVLLEAEDALALQASGTNSGVLHTGFDSVPGELETRMILRSAELRETVLDELEIPLLRCGAMLTPKANREAGAVAALVERARENGVKVSRREDGGLEVPGEAVTDPVAYTEALAGAASGAGAQVRTGAVVKGIESEEKRITLSPAGSDRLCVRVAVNCAGLRADEVARLAGDDSFAIYPRKGEFLVFDPPRGRRLDRVLLPVPEEGTKGVLVFPTVDGKVVAGPTARDQGDKDDWSVRPEAAGEVMPKAQRLLPWLEGVDPIAAYAGLRPAGRGVNYLIGPSSASNRLINVAAIRSTGLTASLAIGERVASLVADRDVELGPDRPLAPGQPPSRRDQGPWWQRTAREKVKA